MESNEVNAQSLLREAERAEAAPFVEYPGAPWWYPVAAGAWFAGLAAAEVVIFQNWNSFSLAAAVAVVAVLVLVALLGAAIGWYRRRWGTWPRMDRAPAEISRAYRRYLVGLVAVVGAVLAVWLWAGPWWGVAAILLLTTVLLTWYEREYAAAARRVRKRLW